MANPSVRSVAIAAGVSPATVSRALSGSPQVRAEVRARVEAVAERLNYRKNALVSSVMRDFRSARGRVHRGTLAFLVCDPPVDWKAGGRAPFVQLFLGGVRARAHAQGYGVETFLIDHPKAMSSARLAQVLASRGIVGLMLCTAARLRQEIDFPWEKFATVAVGGFFFRPRLHRVGRDFYRDVHAIMERLWALGYRRFGFASAEKELERQEYMGLAAFTQFSAQLPAVSRIPPHRPERPNAADLVRWVRRHRPDVVIAELGEALGWLRAAGYGVPEDLGFVSLNTWPGDDTTMAGFLIPFADIGSAAVDLLTKLVEQREIGVPERARAVQVHAEWNEGTTLRPAPTEER